jgi:hypothetical protein
MLLLHGGITETKGRQKVGNEQREEKSKRNLTINTATSWVAHITKKEDTAQPPGR